MRISLLGVQESRFSRACSLSEIAGSEGQPPTLVSMSQIDQRRLKTVIYTVDDCLKSSLINSTVNPLYNDPICSQTF